MDSVHQHAIDDALSITEHSSPSPKRCRTCLLVLPLTDFYNNKNLPGGKTISCRKCIHTYTKRRREAGLDQKVLWARHIKRQYGLTPQQYDDLLEAQAHTCAICKSPEHRGRNWHIDHDHETGKVRGILCYPCNSSIGGMRDNPATLRAAADYLERHGK